MLWCGQIRMRSSTTQRAGQPNGYGVDDFSQPRGQSIPPVRRCRESGTRTSRCLITLLSERLNLAGVGRSMTAVLLSFGLGLRETENPRDERRHRWLDG